MTVAQSAAVSSPLHRPVTALFGVGPERAAQLGRLEIHTIEDLLLHRPRRYEDRRNLRRIGDLQLQEPAITHGKVVALGLKWFRQHTKSVFEIILDDGSGRLHCRWWNLPYMEKYFVVGNEVLVFGKPVGLKPRTIDHPETEVLEGGEESFIHLNRITPIYPLTEGLPQRWLRTQIWRALQMFESQIKDPWSAPTGTEGCWRAFPSRAQGVRMIHFPEDSDQPERARCRLAFDEFMDLQLQIQTRRKNFEAKVQALPCPGDNHLIKPFLTQLGFTLTAAQTSVLRDIRKDMKGDHPMRRLLQGDVGSGKTVVAACCALMALETGYSVALMAPTEILAEQHFLNFSRWFNPLKIAVKMLTGSHKSDQNSSGDRPAPRGQPALFIGTHALLESHFQPDRLGLVIIDEQHRFGVGQREKLVRKGHYPHVLVMTATPIPRTLGLTLYGDLDVSTINHSPPGRGHIKTFIRTADKLPQVWEFIRGKIAEGRQAYVVYPRVEDTGETGIKAVTKEFSRLQESLPGISIALLHGRLKSREKEAVMASFRANRVQVLLATSLVEVGLDVPNATVMLIENAEQFGLAQLHQLRGRIGRGAHDSFCILVATTRTRESQRRLRVLEETADGFKIAEADLALRGPGELLGQQQSGLPRFRFGDLSTDFELIMQARDLAGRLLARGSVTG